MCRRMLLWIGGGVLVLAVLAIVALISLFTYCCAPPPRVLPTPPTPCCAPRPTRMPLPVPGHTPTVLPAPR